MGPDLMENMRKQAERFGAEILYKDVTKVDFSKRPFAITYEDTTVLAESVIISTGAVCRANLALSPMQAPLGHGVTSCATCATAPSTRERKSPLSADEIPRWKKPPS